MASTAVACSVLSAGPAPRSRLASSAMGAGASASSEDDAKPRATSARIAVRQSPELSVSASLVIPSGARTASSSSRCRGARLRFAGVERRNARFAREPAFSQRSRSGAFARELRQRRRDHLAERVVVVLRRPLEKLHHLGVDDRRCIDDFEHCT